MSENLTFERVRDVIADTFGIDPATITSETSAEDVDGWDSVAHASLIVGLEGAFGKTIPIDRAFDVPNVGALVDLLQSL
ncbi:MAG TPA: acyl carrier protein [Vineibacter sp.]|nr:acyl carrier protein [Vineibacter sp.]